MNYHLAVIKLNKLYNIHLNDWYEQIDKSYVSYSTADI